MLTFIHEFMKVHIIFVFYDQARGMVGRSGLSDASIPFCPVDQHWGALSHYRRLASTEWNPNQEGSYVHLCIPQNSLAETLQVGNYM